ncbi:4'-demethylrebeccamycin synthase [Methylobacterium tardum]|jgi:UDP:flavonoid glycosyltransferase YjiC (YdhE family)|uniref:Glycosyl transferase n=1 Tax=Methylobacterium tardum TaxID=374432 RepID=A0AA37TIL5_9HYPH|nr:glycosyltransferase [Methylobacterium tardum]URD35405.1 glycosyltransferase [Methylobacterium tardum]GJE51424.1 4'-demethylrebeccamycin synthase [Methylobacterium tardum]GLS74300.1 glycosyl transferase [Methylobacterium tardum]
MKVLLCSTPATGHLNPLLAIARMLVDDGHEVMVLSGSAFRDRITASGARFMALPGIADFDGRDLRAVVPELAQIPPGPDWLRVAMERIFVDRIPDQHQGLRAALRAFPASVVIGDDMFFGALPLLLGPRAERPAIVLCGTSFLHCTRPDKAPAFMGLPPAESPEQERAYGRIAEAYDAAVDRPVGLSLAAVLAKLGLAAPPWPLFDAVVRLADTYLQLTVPSFEYPFAMPPTVRFIGALPIVPGQAALPPWAGDLDGTRKVVLVTQGTVANHDFGLLVGPALQALAGEPDILTVVTAGGRGLDAIPGPIPANARLSQYLPFEWLLPRIDAMVTNGGYGSVNQALSFGIPLVAAGLTEDKADVNARIAWSGAGIDLATNEPTPAAIRRAVRTVLDAPGHRREAQRLAAAYATYDAKAEILRLLSQYGGGRVRNAA